jgi:hypothetical protein
MMNERKPVPQNAFAFPLLFRGGQNEIVLCLK